MIFLKYVAGLKWTTEQSRLSVKVTRLHSGPEQSGCIEANRCGDILRNMFSHTYMTVESIRVKDASV